MTARKISQKPTITWFNTMRRSLRVAPDRIQQVKLALKLSGCPSQQALAGRIGIARSTLSNFLNGKPVDFLNFVEICEKLGLDWMAIVDIVEAPPTETDLVSNRDQKPSASKEVFKEAANNWDLEKLYADLGSAKRVWADYRQWRLTEVEEQYLRGLLCGYSPDEIAAKLHKEVGSVRVQLSKGLYRYVEELLDRPPNSLENWRDIAIWLAESGYRLDVQFEQKSHDATNDIDALVQEVRNKIKPSIIERCGTAKAVGMNVPIHLAAIYTDVNFLKKITRERWIGIDEMQQAFKPTELQDLSRGEERVPGIEAVKYCPKLMVWGKAGAGKTTFLKHLAIQSIEEKFLEDSVPIFLSLEQFARIGQPDLLSFIIQILTDRQITKTQVIELLNQGKFLILLDSFDEVKEEDADRVLEQIRDFLDRFSLNKFVLACRLAGTQYGFPKFIEVEIADFDDEQITQFANKWFPARKKNTETAAKFLKKLEADKPIKELATNPLLLTMLCLVFEENAEFPNKRFDLYKEAVDIMLIKWDVFRNIERHHIYTKLQLRGKRDLLSCIAYKTFEKGAYFFLRDELEQYITDFIQNLPDAQTDLEALQLDSEKVLESIEAQHGLLVKRARGIYSFSHITIQEYFTAREIINSADPEAGKEAFQKLIEHISESHWREVFLLVVGALKRADYILKLMKKQVDSLIAKDEELQELLTWVNQQSLLVKIPYKKTGVRAFYLDADIDTDPDRKLGCAIDFNCTLVLTHASFLARPLGSDLTSMLDDALDLDLSFVNDDALDPALAIALSRSRAIDTLLIESGANLEPEMKKILEKLQAELPDKNGDMESKLNWLKTHGKAWSEKVKELIVKPHRMGHHYSKLSEEQKELLKQYYDANLLLVECLNIANMSPQVRSEIMDNLLLPITEIEQQEM